MRNDLMFSSNKMDWPTPQDFFNQLDDEFHFTLDPCADDQNHKCEKYFTVEQDGLLEDWACERVFCNPPYGRDVHKWVKKCYEETHKGRCELVVMLLNARTDTIWFHEYIYHKADEIRFVKGRLRFGDHADRAPFPSMVVVFWGKDMKF